MPFRYFAYGSNMFSRKMRIPAPSATFVTVGRIPGFLLRFNKKSDDESGKGYIVMTGNAADEVWGVVFEIADAERAALDKSERGYIPTEIEVLTEAGPLSVVTYVAKSDRIDNSLKPYTWYQEFVIRGAKEHDLPSSYIVQLAAVEAVADHDPARDTKQRSLLGARQSVKELLEGFETLEEPFAPHDVSTAVRNLARECEVAGESTTLAMRAEELGLTLTEEYVHDEGFTWGTYYGPLGVAIDRSGRRLESPSLDEVTPEVISYWEERTRESHHPILRMRYADLVWEFSRRMKQSVSADLPRIVIDATLDAAKAGLFKDAHAGQTRLVRALELALGLRDGERVIAVRDAIVGYECQVADDRLAGTWGFAFDQLIEKRRKHVPMTSSLITEIVADLEARLARLADAEASNTVRDPFAVEYAALRLARYYRRVGDDTNMRRVLATSGASFSAAAEHAAPMLAMAWFERVLDTYRSFGMKGEAESVEVRLRELGPEALKEMKPVTTSTKVPAEEVERFLEAMTADTLDEILPRIAANFIPQKKELAADVQRLAKHAPLGALIRQKIMDSEGRPIAEIGSVETDLEGRVIQQASRVMQLEVPWLRAVLERAFARVHPTPEALRNYLLRAPVFDERKAPILQQGLGAFLTGDAILAAPVLIPQVEDALRTLVATSGGSTYKPHRHGGLVLKNFDDLLREESVRRTLGDDIVHYFQVLFTDQRGWNIRNDVCHGILPAHAFTAHITDRIFHALLILGTVRAHEREAAGE